MDIKEQLGNKALLQLNKTAFLCSRKVPASVVLKCYDWAIEQREKGNCIISGFHSQLEKDVLHYLLKGKQPIIIALARGLKEKLEPEFQKPLEQGRLLIITPFDKKVKRVTEQTAATRNKMMIELADNITVGYASVGGQLERLLKLTNKKIQELLSQCTKSGTFARHTKQREMPEQQNIQYKQSWLDDYLKWVCGFANLPAGKQARKVV